MLREITLDDIDFLFNLVNERENRKNSLNQEPISFQEHKDWFLNKLKEIENNTSKIYIYEIDNEKIGQVRLDKHGIFHHLDISVTRKKRGKGLAKNILLELMSMLKDITILAYVKNSNIASKALFASCKFTKLKECNNLSYYKIKL